MFVIYGCVLVRCKCVCTHDAYTSCMYIHNMYMCIVATMAIIHTFMYTYMYARSYKNDTYTCVKPFTATIGSYVGGVLEGFHVVFEG